MRFLALSFTLLPLPALAHGVHTVPVDGHSHSVLPVALAIVAIAGVAALLLRARR